MISFLAVDTCNEEKQIQEAFEKLDRELRSNLGRPSRVAIVSK